MAKSTIIEVVGLNKYFGQRHAVIDLDFHLDRGQIVGFVGPNGGGKTTLMRMLCGLLIPSSGRGYCLGYDILTQYQEIKTKTGYMVQKFSLYEDLTVFENLNFVATIYGVDNRAQKIEDMIEEFDLSDRRHQLTASLSGGWKQRVALAACLVHSPELLLLDEPTAGVDPKARQDFWRILYGLKQKGISILVSTHYMDEAQRCDRLVYIKEGRLLIEGTPEAILEKAGLASLEEVFIHLLEKTV